MAFDDLQQDIDDHEERIADLEQIQSDQSDSQDGLSQAIQDLQDQLAQDEQNIGHLDYPLSQEDIDAISEQAPAGLQYLNNNGYIGTAVLVAGTVTVANSLITASSLVLLGVKTAGGTQGDLSYTVSAGSLVINSSSATDTSTVIYFILIP